MNVPHLDAGRIYRLAPFEEVVTELRKTFANRPPVVRPQPAPPLRASTAGQASYVLLGNDESDGGQPSRVPVGSDESAASRASYDPRGNDESADGQASYDPLGNDESSATSQTSNVSLGNGQPSAASLASNVPAGDDESAAERASYIPLGNCQLSAVGQGTCILLGDDGAAVATLDGAALAARRTPAVSALATDALARDDVRRLAVFGTDVQAREHVRAMRWVRPSLEQIEIVGHEPVATERFVAMLRGEGHPAVVATSADVANADLICMCTWRTDRMLYKLSAGTHVNAIGCGELPMGRVLDDLAALARGEVRRETLDEVTIFVPTARLVEEDLVVATLAARNAGLIA